MTHTLEQSVSTEQFSDDHYRIYLTRDLTWTERNSLHEKTPVTPIGEWGATATKYDEEFMRRLSSFVVSCADFSLDAGTMWDQHIDTHRPLLAALAEGQLQPAYKYLTLQYQMPIMNGMCQGAVEYQPTINYPNVPEMYLQRHWDVFLGLSEYCGVIGPQNHEQGASYVATPIDMLANALPAFIQAPQWRSGLWCLKTARGLFHERDLMALYIALKIKEKNIVTENSKIVEIGAGAGFVVYWLHKLGYKNVHAVDLPSVICAQAFQLAQNIGAENICLPHENHPAAVKLMTPGQFKQQTDQVDLVINCDSMPEMDEAWLHDYLQIIGTRVSNFYSINQETRAAYKTPTKVISQHVVRSVIKKNFSTQIVRTDRSKFWLRDGYAEEWYKSA